LDDVIGSIDRRQVRSPGTRYKKVELVSVADFVRFDPTTKNLVDLLGCRRRARPTTLVSGASSKSSRGWWMHSGESENNEFVKDGRWS